MKLKGSSLLCLLSLATLLAGGTEGAPPRVPPNHHTTPFNRTLFPSGFLFGVGSSAYQVEGAAHIDGKGPSIWDTYTKLHGDKIRDHSSGETSVDFYHRYKRISRSDIKVVKEIGLDSYRFSISWSRIFPKGRGAVNPLGVQFYNNLINEILSNGLKPFVTLFHWDLPQALEDEYGGFLSHKVVADFHDYAEFCFKTFGDRVKHWVSLNEPGPFSLGGYSAGYFAPGRCSKYAGNCTVGDSATEPYIVAHHLILAHATAASLYKNKYQAHQKGQIGITIVTHFFEPKSNTEADRKAVRRALDFFFGWFAHPVTYGDYPDKYAAPVSTNRTFYTDMQASITTERNGVAVGTPTDLNWLFVHPKGILNLTAFIRDTYMNPPIYITENGVAEARNDSKPINEARKDSIRIRYHDSHLKVLLEAIKEGVNVKGYYAWSFSDSFEWDAGYTVRFGLIYVDYKNNLRRYPNYSAFWLKKFLLK
ncbi:hypothetical protein CR513_31718, partial [Mucuna pruriens]